MEHGYNISLVLMEHGYMRQGGNFFSSGKWHIDKFQAKLRISNICLRSSTGFNLINVSFYAILFQIRTFVENRILTQTFTPINQILLRFYQTSELKSILLAPLVKSLNFQTLSYLSRKMPPRREKKQGSTMGEVGRLPCVTSSWESSSCSSACNSDSLLIDFFTMWFTSDTDFLSLATFRRFSAPSLICKKINVNTAPILSCTLPSAPSWSPCGDTPAAPPASVGEERARDGSGSHIWQRARWADWGRSCRPGK